MPFPRVRLVAALGTLASLAAVSPSAQTSVIDIGRLGPESSFLWAVNERNQAVGWSELAGRDTEHGILWEDRQLVDLGVLSGFPVSRALDINNRGQIVGFALELEFFRSRALLWDDGVPIDICPPGTTNGSAAGINNRGDIVGACNGRATLWRHGVPVTLPTPPDTFTSYATAINEAGVIVGGTSPRLGPGGDAVRWVRGETEVLPLPPGAVAGSAQAVNARGTIVGYVTFPAGIEPAIWRGDTVAPLAGAWGVFSGIAWGINDRGDVVVRGFHSGIGEGGGFVWHDGVFRVLQGDGFATDINNRGVAVGRMFIVGSEEHGAVWPGAAASVSALPARRAARRGCGSASAADRRRPCCCRPAG